MSLTRRGMRAQARAVPAPILLAQVRDLLQETTSGEAVATLRELGRIDSNITGKLETIMHSLDDLLAAVAGQRTQIDSLVALAASLRQQVIEAMGATLTPSQQDRIDRAFAAISDNADAVAAAVKANTVEATSGAVSGGPDMADIKSQLNPGRKDPESSGSVNVADPDGKPATGGDPNQAPVS